jgi:hypothetical protein
MGMMFNGMVKNQERTGPDSFLPQDNPASVIFIGNFYTRISVHDSVRLLLFAAGFLIQTKENAPVFTLPTRNNPILQGPSYTINPPFYDFMQDHIRRFAFGRNAGTGTNPVDSPIDDHQGRVVGRQNSFWRCLSIQLTQGKKWYQEWLNSGHDW